MFPKQKSVLLALSLSLFFCSVIFPNAATNETVRVTHLAKGKYTLELYKVGHRVNDAYATYRDLGAPNQLTNAQVAEIKSKNSGTPLETRTVKIGRDGKFTEQFDLRDNDAVLTTLTPQR